ncbi:MAG: O-methyltransferase [Pseudomonadota bacterium]
MTLREPRLDAVLQRLHQEAALDGARWAERRAAQAAGRLPDDEGLVRMGEFYLAVSPDEGRLLYLLARAARARRMVEFGASYGVSTLYLAAAARDGGGHLTTTEAHPDKCRALRANLAEAGVADCVTLLEGDALLTLADLPGPVDLLLLDGWKSLYLPVLRLLEPSLAQNALVLADNVDHEAAQDYLAAVSDSDAGFLTHRMGDMAVSLYLGGQGKR